MWTEIKKENSFTAAKKLADNIEKLGGVPSRILPPKGPEAGTYTVYAPKDKAHLLEDLLKRLSAPPKPAAPATPPPAANP